MPAASCALRGGLRLLRQPPDNATAPMGAAVIVCADGKFPATSAENWGRNSLPYVAACLRKPATGSFAAEMDGRSARPFSLCERETEKRNEVNERWQFTIWKQKWSAGAQAAPPWTLPLSRRAGEAAQPCADLLLSALSHLQWQISYSKISCRMEARTGALHRSGAANQGKKQRAQNTGC